MGNQTTEKVLSFIESLDPERTSRVIVAPMFMAFFGAWRIARNLDRLLPFKVTFGKAWSVITIFNWFIYFAARQATGGYLGAKDSYEAAKEGLRVK